MLKEWMTTNRRPRAWMAAKLCVQEETVSRLCSGKQKPSLSLAAHIEEITGIPAASWIKRSDA